MTRAHKPSLRRPWDAYFAQIMEHWLPPMGLEVRKKLKVGKLPLEVDLVVIRRQERTPVMHPLWQHLSAHNLLEFKSAGDRFLLRHWHTLLSYAGLYRNQQRVAPQTEVGLWLLVPRFPAVLRRYMTGVSDWKSLLPGVETGRYGHYPLVVVSYRDLPEEVSFDPLAIFEKRRASAVVTRMLQGQEDASIRDELTSMAAQLYLPLVREALRMKRKIKWDRESIQALVEAVDDKEIFVKAVGEKRFIKVLGKAKIIESLGEEGIIETLGEERVLNHFTVEQLEKHLRKKKQPPKS